MSILTSSLRLSSPHLLSAHLSSVRLSFARLSSLRLSIASTWQVFFKSLPTNFRAAYSACFLVTHIQAMYPTYKSKSDVHVS